MGKWLACRVREMSDVQAAWVGAIIEAEGSVVFTPRTSLHYARIQVSNTDVEIISALMRTTGVGSVCLLQQSKLGTKDCWCWAVQARNDIQSLVRQCSLYAMKLQRT